MNQRPPADDHPDLFTRDFLLGKSIVRENGHSLSAAVIMDSHKEGWVGIPHGGIGMGAAAEMALLLNDSEHSYPFTADFRLGGTSARVSDTFHLKAEKKERAISGVIHVNGEQAPYLKSEIRFGEVIKTEQPPEFLPSVLPIDESRLRPLPIYSNCFVCGTDRRMPGLKRKFHLLEAASGEKVAISTAGFEPSDAASFFLFRRGDGVHPVAFTALLDETLGWGGFMLAATGAVTVRINFSFLREVTPGEKIIFYGFGEKVRGKAGSRLLFWAKGGAVVVKEGGHLEPVAAASGQWLAVPELTRQMHENLIPSELTREAFGHAVYPDQNREKQG